VANTHSTSKYFSETSTNIKDAYHQLPYYQKNNPSLRKSNHPNDQLHPQEEELGQYLADIFSHLNINEQEESIQQTTKQASHQKNRRQEEQNPEKEGSDKEEKDKRTTEKKDDNMSESDSGNKQELKGVRIPNPKTLTGDGEDRGAKGESTLGSIEFKIGLK
jgi:hypothetical protein